MTNRRRSRLTGGRRWMLQPMTLHSLPPCCTVSKRSVTTGLWWHTMAERGEREIDEFPAAGDKERLEGGTPPTTYAAAWVLLSDGERGHVEMEARDRDWNVDDDDVVVVRRRRTIAGVAGVAGGS
ncbi:hypothetical protein HanPI659440_Chr11g0402681 [Helianthus annuus]|nr:hypothetical protein HanPI659440_Chr11g0402681 [Helianthus annuus]